MESGSADSWTPYPNCYGKTTEKEAVCFLIVHDDHKDTIQKLQRQGHLQDVHLTDLHPEPIENAHNSGIRSQTPQLTAWAEDSRRRFPTEDLTAQQRHRCLPTSAATVRSSAGPTGWDDGDGRGRSGMDRWACPEGQPFGRGSPFLTKLSMRPPHVPARKESRCLRSRL